MSPILKIAAVVVLVLTGPAMYVASRSHQLTLGYSHVQVGDTTAAVRASMGKPQEEAPGVRSPNTGTEYRYSAWPYPRVWVIAFRDGKVVNKAEVAR
jgi:hypothetical protein